MFKRSPENSEEIMRFYTNLRQERKYCVVIQYINLHYEKLIYNEYLIENILKKTRFRPKETVQILTNCISKGAIIKKDGSLLNKIALGSFNIIGKLLLEQGAINDASIDMKTKYLQNCIWYKSIDMINILLDKDIDIKGVFYWRIYNKIGTESYRDILMDRQNNAGNLMMYLEKECNYHKDILTILIEYIIYLDV